MRTPNGSRRTALVAAAALTAAAATYVLWAGGPATASAAATHIMTASEPVITPVAAALIPGPIDIDRRHASNVVTVRLDIKPGGTTGWHSHPGAVLVQVVSGAVTLTHASHGRCLSQVVGAGHGFFEKPGAVHEAGNRQLEPAVLFATFVLPQGAPPADAAAVPSACR